MRLFRALALTFSMFAVAALGSPASAAPEDAVFNKEGYWGIDVDRGVCVASMTLQGGAVFLLRAVEGHVGFALIGRTPLRRGKAGRLETDSYVLEFDASYSEGGETLFYDGEFEAKALAGLRTGGELRILVDGRMVTAMTLEGTGFADAFDGLIACSEGKSGWWGPGLAADAQSESSAPPLNTEGYWAILPAEDEPGVCSAVVPVDDDLAFMLIANHEGRMVFAVSSGEPMRRGRKGRFETDAYSFDFLPGYDSDTLVFGEDLDSRAIFALRRARTAKISIGGRTLVDMALEETGHAAVMDNLVACANGEAGWWGAGAAKP